MNRVGVPKEVLLKIIEYLSESRTQSFPSKLMEVNKFFQETLRKKFSEQFGCVKIIGNDNLPSESIAIPLGKIALGDFCENDGIEYNISPQLETVLRQRESVSIEITHSKHSLLKFNLYWENCEGGILPERLIARLDLPSGSHINSFKVDGVCQDGLWIMFYFNRPISILSFVYQNSDKKLCSGISLNEAFKVLEENRFKQQLPQ